MKNAGKKKNNGHKCDLDIIRKNKISVIESNSFLTWNEQYNKVVENMNTKKMNILLLGGGGVGKTYMIKKLNEQYNIINTASTGVASVNIEGCTIHQLLKLNHKKECLIKFNNEKNKYMLSNELFETCDFIVIDEISMIDGKTFDIIINRLKYINDHKESSGNINLIIVGDCMHLPPIDTDSGYFFNGGEFNKFEKNSYTFVLKEIKRQNNKEFIEILERVRLALHTKDDIKYIINMKNNNVDENEAVYMCAKNKDVDEINKKYFDNNINVANSFMKKIKYFMNKKEVDKLPKDDNNMMEKHILKRANDVLLKKNMKIMITENIDVPNGICNGTIGEILDFEDNNIIIKTIKNDVIKVSYYKVEEHQIKFKNDDNVYSIIMEYMPIKQCNAITIHKSQGATLDKCILNCDGIFEKSMFYTALSRIINPDNMKILNFKESYIKCNKSAFEYETENKYISYFELMLIDNDEDKLNKLKIKPSHNILEENTIIYDFECATQEKRGHTPYFNHLIKLYNGVIDQEQTFCHYINSTDVNKDTFEYVMKIVVYQCDMFLKGKQTENNALKKEFKNPLYLCGFNSANYDLYFFYKLIIKITICYTVYIKNYF